MWNKREFWCFFPNHKMNHKVAEEFHGLCACSSICDLEDYWSQLGAATVLPPRGSVNKTQMLGKIIAKRHQNISHHASTLRAREVSTCQSYKRPLRKKSNHQKQNKEGITIFPHKPAPPFPFSAPFSIQMPEPETQESFLTSPLPFFPTLPDTHCHVHSNSLMLLKITCLSFLEK